MRGWVLQNSYLRVKSLDDGKGYGVGGHWGGNDYAADMVSRRARVAGTVCTPICSAKYRISDSKRVTSVVVATRVVRKHWAAGFRETAAKI